MTTWIPIALFALTVAFFLVVRLWTRRTRRRYLTAADSSPLIVHVPVASCSPGPVASGSPGPVASGSPGPVGSGTGPSYYPDPGPAPMMAAPEYRSGQRQARTKLRMAILVSLIVVASALYMVLSQDFGTDAEKWAFGSVGTILGYWLSPD